MTKQPEVFPAGYARRWARRYLFGARRFALVERRRKALADGPVAAARALLREAVLSLWWFLVLRPWDAVSVARRRLPPLLRPNRHRASKAFGGADQKNATPTAPLKL